MSSVFKDYKIPGLKDDFELNRMRNGAMTEKKRKATSNKEENPTEPDNNHSESESVPKAVSSSSKPDQSEGNKTLEAAVEGKMDNISELQATEYKRDMAEGHVSVGDITGVHREEKKIRICADTRTNCNEEVEIELRDEEDRTFWKVQPPPKCKRKAEGIRVNNIENPATLGNVNRLI
jgi:hypothetical protein